MMWLGKNTRQSMAERGADAQVGQVTIGGQSAAVLLSGELRDVKALAPAGIDWLPESGQQALLLQTGDGERYIIGTPTSARELEPGELRLRCGSSYITVGKEGIYMNGDLSIFGDIYVYGRLFVNGSQVGA